jgi:hypothetical protein
MGTRSLTIVYEDENPIINMYRQFDGYVEGHGLELAEFLGEFEAITNGIRVGETRKTANGMGCLAAQLIAHFKKDVGGFYLYPTSATDCGQEYEYHVYYNSVVVKAPEEVIFTGSWKKFVTFCKTPVNQD